MPGHTPTAWGQNVNPADLRNNKEIEMPPHDVTLQQPDRPSSWADVQPFSEGEIQAFFREGEEILASGAPLDMPAFGVPTLTYLRLLKTVTSTR